MGFKEHDADDLLSISQGTDEGGERALLGIVCIIVAAIVLVALFF